MPISETVQYAIIFSLTLIFTVFALTLEKDPYKMLLKMVAGTCWFVMAIIQYILIGVSSVLTVPFSVLFGIFGLFFYLSTILEWFAEKKTDYGNKRTMGVFD